MPLTYPSGDRIHRADRVTFDGNPSRHRLAVRESRRRGCIRSRTPTRTAWSQQAAILKRKEEFSSFVFVYFVPSL